MLVEPHGWTRLGVAKLGEWMKARGEMPQEWYDDVRDAARARALAAKKVSCPGAPKCVQELHHEHRADGQVKFPKERKKEPTPGA